MNAVPNTDGPHPNDTRESLWQQLQARIAESRQRNGELIHVRVLLRDLANAYQRTEQITHFGGNYRAYDAARAYLAEHSESTP